MRAPSTGLLAGGVIALTAVVLAIIGAPHGRPPPAPPQPPEAGVPASSIAAGGIRLTSAAMELPADEAAFPGGHRSDLVNANCTACHSASMVLGQPKLSEDQWLAEVTKMREVYKAPVRPGDVGDIVRYLAGLSDQASAETVGKAQGPVPTVPLSRS